MTSTLSAHVPLHRCRDYVRISSGSFGSQEACGQDMSVDFNPYLQSKIMYIVLSFGMQALLCSWRVWYALLASMGMSMETPPFTMSLFHSSHGQVVAWYEYSSSETDGRTAS